MFIFAEQKALRSIVFISLEKVIYFVEIIVNSLNSFINSTIEQTYKKSSLVKFNSAKSYNKYS